MKHLALLLLLGLMLAACSDSAAPETGATPSPTMAPAAPTAPQTVQHELDGTSWRLVEMRVSGEEITIFDDRQRISFSAISGRTGEFNGHDGCNEIWGELVIGAGDRRLDLTEIGQTLRECPEEAVAQIGSEETPVWVSVGPRAVKEALSSVVSYELREGSLWLFYPQEGENALVFRRG